MIFVIPILTFMLLYFGKWLFFDSHNTGTCDECGKWYYDKDDWYCNYEIGMETRKRVCNKCKDKCDD